MTELDKLRFWEKGTEAPAKTIVEFSNIISQKVEDKKKKISKTNIVNEFREWFKIENPEKKIPKAQELVDYLNIHLGPYKDRGWRGYEIIYDDYDSDSSKKPKEVIYLDKEKADEWATL